MTRLASDCRLGCERLRIKTKLLHWSVDYIILAHSLRFPLHDIWLCKFISINARYRSSFRFSAPPLSLSLALTAPDQSSQTCNRAESLVLFYYLVRENCTTMVSYMGVSLHLCHAAAAADPWARARAPGQTTSRSHMPTRFAQCRNVGVTYSYIYIYIYPLL